MKEATPIFLKILKAITYPIRRLYDLVHNGQADIEAVYPESFHPTAEEAARQAGVMGGMNIAR